MQVGNLKRMFDPSTIVVIGATEKEGSVGRLLVENLLLYKNRRLFCVNPSRETVLGVHCHGSVSDISEPIDLAVVVTPAKEVPEAVEARILIPMKLGERSLNVSLACAMVTGEALRQTAGFPNP